MRVKRFFGVGAALLLMGMASEARADIIFSVNQGSVNPDEQVLFDGCAGCVNGPALTVVGGTNKTNFLVSFTSDELLVADASGQARVQAEDDDGINSFVLIDTVDSSLFFSEFETNVRIVSNEAGTGTVEACNQLGDPCEIFVLNYAGGENFFVLSVIDPQLIDTVRINAGDVAILSIQQTRVSLAEDGDDVTIPEPATLSLLGLGMFFGATRLRRKSAAAE